MSNAVKIRRLNDAFRRALHGGGKRLMTDGICALPYADQISILQKVREHVAFPEGDDPYGEYDFGAFDHASESIFWKIDYYDPAMEFASEDPADEAKTVRALTVLLASEY